MLNEAGMTQLRESVEQHRIVQLQDVGARRENISCIPLRVGPSILTVCEINRSGRFDRVICVEYAEIGVFSPIHGYSDLLQYCLDEQSQDLPDTFPMGDSWEDILRQVMELENPCLAYSKNAPLCFGRVCATHSDLVSFDEIDLAGFYILPVEVQLGQIVRIDIGGAMQRLRLQHANQHRRSEQGAADQLPARRDLKSE